MAVTCVFAALPPFLPSAAFIAIAKHAACAAAISSSGLVLPAGSPIRSGNVTGSEKAPLPALRPPCRPSIRLPNPSSRCVRTLPCLPPMVRPEGGPYFVDHYDRPLSFHLALTFLARTRSHAP